MSQHPLVSVVIIGRNEGQRLVRCINSIAAMEFDPNQLEVIYVDSGSSDGSLERARSLGAHAVPVPPGPTTAARGRNTGYAEAKGTYLFFLDGDTIVDPQFLKRALAYLEEHPECAGVCGDRREIVPYASIYNRVQDLEWNGPEGPVGFFGGDTVVRRSVLEQVGPYRAELVAGEEPELCHRIRMAGYTIMHLAIPMTGHDLALYHFKGYWKRCYRTGYAYAEVSELTGGETWGPQSKRNRIQALVYMLAPLLMLALLGWWAVPVMVFGASLVLARTVWRSRWRKAPWLSLWIYAIHGHFCQLPIFFGQLKYLLNRRRNIAGRIIEYK